MGGDRVRRLALLAAAGLSAALLAPSAAPAQGEPALPGSPPGAGADLPAPPGARALPAAPAPPPVTVEADPQRPNLIDVRARVARRSRQVRFPVYCRANGRARLSAPRLGRGTLAVSSYRCGGGRATATLRLPRAAARRLSRLRTTLGRVTLRQGSATVSSAVTLLGPTAQVRDRPVELWTDGSLQCSPTGQPEAYLVAPNWTATPATPIYMRPWVAIYSATTGWRWIGVGGDRVSRWHPFTATPRGVAEWQQPNGVLAPWTWGPIRMPLGRNTFAVGVFEVVYWWSGGPRYVSSYVRPGTTGLAPASPFCRYL